VCLQPEGSHGVGIFEIALWGIAMHQVFISYSSGDRGWAEVLEQRLIPHVNVYRDKTRLTAAGPFQDQLFAALEQSTSLLIIWSERARDGQNKWKEWVITEREHFRAKHPDGPIIYLLLDDAIPQVDAHTHKLDDVKGENSPEKISDVSWGQLIHKVKKAVSPSRIEVDAYVLACTTAEFATLKGNPNLDTVLHTLGLDFNKVAAWYGPTREDWRPAGMQQVANIFNQLELMAAEVLNDDGVPEFLKGNQVIINRGLTELWNPLDDPVHAELDRLIKLDFIWVFVDPLSLYHPIIQVAANRIAGVIKKNRWLNLFIVDPIGGIHDRGCLREKLMDDFSSLYDPIVKPQIRGNRICLGGVDVWHAHDFERVFRETIRLRSESSLTTQGRQSAERGFATMGAGG